jgi:cytosine/adenosine deaminase-related metal-dependent hydrolase
VTSGPTVYRAAWLLPVATAPIASGALRVDVSGCIEAVGPADQVSSDGARIVDLGNAAILPGLVNLHAHPELTILRGRLEAAGFTDWIEQLVELKYRSLTPAALQASTGLGVAEAIAAGVTCLAATDDAGFLLEAMVEAGLRGRVYREVFGPAPEQAEPALAELRKRIAAMRGSRGDLVDVGISPHAPYTVSPGLFEALAGYAAAEALPVCIHAAESEAEERFTREGRGAFAERLRARGIAVQAAGTSPIAWLAETGILQTGPLLVHCVRVDAEDVARIAAAGGSIAHCPISNAKFGHGVAPLPDFLEAGIPVGLGSDSVASNNRVDVLEEARFAALVQRAITGEPGILPAAELLRLATLEGAKALGLESRIGSLVAGKEADIIAVRFDRPHTVPTADPAAALFHSARGGDVVLTIVRGRVLYRDGEFTTLDFDALAEAVRPTAARRRE